MSGGVVEGLLNGRLGAWLAAILSSPWLAPILLALAIIQQIFSHHNADNSWLFTVDDKILDGARPYVDVLETNPDQPLKCPFCKQEFRLGEKSAAKANAK